MGYFALCAFGLACVPEPEHVPEPLALTLLVAYANAIIRRDGIRERGWLLSAVCVFSNACECLRAGEDPNAVKGQVFNPA